MKNQTRIPVKDADFNNYINLAIPYLNANKTKLAITTTAQANLTLATALLTTASTGWNSIYSQSINPLLSTSIIVETKMSVRLQIETLLRAIYDDIPKSVLTAADRATFNIPAPVETRTAAQKPTSVPILSISERGHLTVTISILDAINFQTISNVPDAALIELESAFIADGKTVPVGFPSDEDFRHLATLGKSLFQRDYTDKQLKGTEFLKARYLSSRKESGGWSEVFTVVVA